MAGIGLDGAANAADAMDNIGFRSWFGRFGDNFLENLLGDSFTILVLTIAARAGWGIAYWGWRFLKFYFSPAVAELRIEFDKPASVAHDPGIDFESIDVFCQIVRFGADDYIQNLANDREKFEGRLQNRVLPVRRRATGSGYRGQLLLPVHRRLGTQFKMFLLAPSRDVALDLLKTPYFRPKERHAKRHGRRISFTLAGVGTIENTEKTTVNNMLYPSHLHDFAKWNSFGPLYLAVQRWRWRLARTNRPRLQA